MDMVQGSPTHRRHVKRLLLASLDKVLRRLDTGDNLYHQEPASINNMLMGDASWATRKLVLGWLLDAVATTIQLPLHRLTRLFKILDTIGPNQRRTMVNKRQKVLGELHSMVPDRMGLFSALHNVLPQKSEHGTNAVYHRP
jgi:hypothetical protein